MRSAPRRILSALVALVLGLGVTEGVLQVGALFWRQSRERARPERREVEGLTILCHGDSNVYGLFVQEGESYPERLGALLEASEPGRHQVLSRGVPGLDTRGLLARLERDLDEVRPDLLLLTIGANNEWAWVGEGGPPWYERLVSVRVVRLLLSRESVEEADVAQAGASLDGDGGTGVGRDRSRRVSAEDKLASIGRDVGEIARLARGREIEVRIVGYGAEATVYESANAALRSTSDELELAFLAPSGALARLAEAEGFHAAFFPDLHPRARGYELIARLVFNDLVAAGLVSGEPIADPFAGLQAEAPSPVQLALVGDPAAPAGDPRALAVEVSGGPPGARFQVFLWGLHREPSAPGPVNFQSDPLMSAVRDAGGLQGELDGAGTGRASLDRLRAQAPEGMLAGLLVFATCQFGGTAAGNEVPMPAPVELALP